MTLTRSTQLQGITDLTVFADVQPGLIKGIFDSRSYAWRLVRVLDLLDAARRAARESDMQPNPLVDSVARLRDIHFFRFAVLPSPTGARLLLNVTFDGGWEPYMRLIWKPLGTLLDLIFCHCVDYPLAATSSFDTYIQWVRQHEVPSQFFYADSGGSVADRAYLEALAARQRSEGQRPGADLRAAQMALQPMQPPQPTPAAVQSAVRMLKGLYALASFFGPLPASTGPVPRDDASVLLRFAQDLLPDMRDWIAQGLFDPGQRFDALRSLFETERDWLMKRRWTRPELADPAMLGRQEVQACILDSPRPAAGGFVRGALVLVQLADAQRALGWLSAATRPSATGAALVGDATQVQLAGAEVACSVAITYPGLVALGIQQRYLDLLPAEFVQGMAARAGILGDLRINNPLQWMPPRAKGRPESVELSLVHLLIQLRTGELPDDPQADRSQLLPRLRQWIDTHLAADSGMTELATEASWSQPAVNGEPAARNHFGYVDGISQPVMRPPSSSSQFWDDGVKTGELFLGWVNDRGDGPRKSPQPGDAPSAADTWLRASTFLVLRKMQQFADRFERMVDDGTQALLVADPALRQDEARELVRAKLMGRSSDGSPMPTPRGPGLNDFDYRYDADGRSCPFASQVRRANPRATLAGGMQPPRILRRGMGYGAAVPAQGQPGRDQAERGVLFMAYNASIAEQFEVIQRWVSGGNSSGVSCAQADPFLGVPHQGEPTVYTFSHGDQVVRIDLGDQPVCRLLWGLYAWVPPIAQLAALKDLTLAGRAAPTPAPAPAPAPRPPETAEETNQRVKAEFEDDPVRAARWKAVHDGGGVERIGSNVMVGSAESVLKVLRDDGSKFSAAEYGQRMAKTVGRCPFGQDDAGADAGHQRAFVADVKQAVVDFMDERAAFEAAVTFVWPRLQQQLKVARVLGQPASVDILALGADLLAELLHQWFGVVYDGTRVVPGMNGPTSLPVRCPGHFLTVARYVFSPRPNDTVIERATGQRPQAPPDPDAKGQGQALKDAVQKWVAAATMSYDDTQSLIRRVLAAMDKPLAAGEITPDQRQAMVANVMLGLPATLLGSWTKLVLRSVADRSLWRLQQQLPIEPSTKDGPPAPAYQPTVDALRKGLITALAGDPVADGIWRTVRGTHQLGNVMAENGDIVWLGLGAALQGARGSLKDDEWLALAEALLFGGAWDPKAGYDTTHGCPGRRLATGVLLGALASLLAAGELSATASPTILNLKPFSVG